MREWKVTDNEIWLDGIRLAYRVTGKGGGLPPVQMWLPDTDDPATIEALNSCRGDWSALVVARVIEMTLKRHEASLPTE